MRNKKLLLVFLVITLVSGLLFSSVPHFKTTLHEIVGADDYSGGERFYFTDTILDEETWEFYYRVGVRTFDGPLALCRPTGTGGILNSVRSSNVDPEFYVDMPSYSTNINHVLIDDHASCVEVNHQPGASGTLSDAEIEVLNIHYENGGGW